MTDLLITGAQGQLGRALVAGGRARGMVVVGHDVDTLDIRSAAAVREMVDRVGPLAVINCAAATDVDGCEDDPDTAFAVNGEAVGHLADACNSSGARLVHISTDYVFSGSADRPYAESDAPEPGNVYGRSKLLGEELARRAERHIIARTAWLYGVGGANFVESIRRQVSAGTQPLRVVADQQGSPTLCDDLAIAILDLVASDADGVVHAVNSGFTSWHGFACEIVRRLGRHVEVLPIRSADFPRRAHRPANSRLDTSRLVEILGHPLPPWQDALGRYLERT
jgi:dTDP-4-dehydrorhamnose reductase